MDTLEPLAKLMQTVRQARPLLAEVVAALCRPEVDAFLGQPNLRNGTVTVKVRIVNGRVTYVIPTVEAELKVSLEVASKGAARPN